MNCALHFLSEDLNEQPIFPVEPKDKLPGSEVDRLQAFDKILAWIAPTIASWAVPNAGKRGFTAQRQAKREGMVSGVFDKHYAAQLSWYAALEWKDAKGVLSPNQVMWGNSMHRKGFRVACVRTPEFAEQLFREWRAPFIDRRGRL